MVIVYCNGIGKLGRISLPLIFVVDELVFGGNGKWVK
jgi:hypothetical protein